MINSFKQYLVEEERTVYFTFGRMNPPTVGHEMLLDKLAAAAGRNPYRVFLSQSNDAKDNPLNYTDKVKFVRKMFPKHARSVMINKKVVTPFHALSALYDEGFRKIVMVAGSDRVQEYDLRLNKYNGKKGAHGFYNFEGGIKLVSAGQRDPDAKGAEGASGTKQRTYATDNNFTKFSQGLPKGASNKDAKQLFNAVRKGMGLKEQKEFKRHVQLEPVSDLREAYIRDNIFELGETVVLNRKDGIVGQIKHLGSNYLIVESKGEKWRCWLDDVSKLNPNDEIKYSNFDVNATPESGVVKESLTEGNLPDWGTPESTRRAKQMTPGEQQEEKDTHVTKDGKTAKKGLWYNIHKRREKGLPPKKPGQKGYPKTLDIEERTMDQVKDIISNDKQDLAKDKEAMKKKHDRMMDRARRSRMLRKNKGIKS